MIIFNLNWSSNMLESKFRPTEASFQQISDYLANETETSHYTIDCYPYAIQGIVFGLLFSTIFWGIVVAVLMLIL